MKLAVLIDFGSTYIKLTCVDIGEGRLIGADKFPSASFENAKEGLSRCFKAAEGYVGSKNFEGAVKAATSSAAGGLRMAVSGLTESLSISAGRNASFSAGAKIVYNNAGLLTEKELADIENSSAEILLLCGGYEGGNTSGILHNAEALSQSRLRIPVIYAGNSMVAPEIRRMFKSKDKECFLAENIIPAVGELNVNSTVSIVRDLFMNRITNMKGVGVVQKELQSPITPTPAAVLAAGSLLCEGTKNQEGVGPMMMIDVGGATTDIYSYIDNTCFMGAQSVGCAEPFAKRTVEGDMGMRESSACVMREAGRKKMSSECRIDEEKLERSIERRVSDKSYLADTDEEKQIDKCIAANAVRISARRHAGFAAKEYSGGCRLIQHGKNLSEIKTVIGTGGVIINGENAGEILKNVQLSGGEEGFALLPQKVDVMVDNDYVLFAAGLLRKYDDEAALTVMKRSLRLY